MRLFTLRGPVLRVPWPLVIAGWALRAGGRLVLLAVRHPWLALAAAALTGLWAVTRSWGLGPVAVLLLIVAGALVAWSWAWPTSWEQWAAQPARSRWRKHWVYRRNWQPATVLAGLARPDGTGGRLDPQLVRVTSTDTVDAVVVRPVPGQTVKQWQDASDQLRAAFGARRVSVRRSARTDQLILWVHRRGQALTGADALETAETPVSAFPRTRQAGSR